MQLEMGRGALPSLERTDEVRGEGVRSVTGIEDWARSLPPVNGLEFREGVKTGCFQSMPLVVPRGFQVFNLRGRSGALESCPV